MNQTVMNKQKSHLEGGCVSYKELLKWEACELARILGIHPSNELKQLVDRVREYIDDQAIQKRKPLRRLIV